MKLSRKELENRYNELDAKYNELRARADQPGPDRHSQALGYQMVDALKEMASIKHSMPEPVAPPPVIHTEHSLEEAEGILAAMATPNEFLKAVIAEARASMPGSEPHVNEPPAPEPAETPAFLASIGLEA